MLMVETPEFRRGIDLFNREHFFDAHEVWEDVWRPLTRDGHLPRRFRVHVQGMVQLAVAFHHQSAGNYVGARSVLERALRNLDGADASFPDLDLARLRGECALWRRFLHDHLGNEQKSVDGERASSPDATQQPAPPLPKIVWR